jgi:hypothetical protein
LATNGSFLAQAIGSERGQGILYVDDDAPAGGGGSTWNTAIRLLQDALDTARQPGSNVTEVRVAQGMYKPDQGAKVTPGDIHATFLIPPTVSLRGGYAGIGTADPDARDWDRFESILSGDLLGNDPNPPPWPPTSGAWLADNSLRIATLNDGEATTIVEGLVVTASDIDSNTENIGGGLYCTGGQPSIAHCEFRYNRAYRGGGLALQACDGVVRDSQFHHNFATYGGGAHLAQSAAIVQRCEFTNNRCAPGGSHSGGAMGVLSGTPVIRDCQFDRNVAPQGASAGAIGLGFGTTTIERCTFSFNEADIGGAIAGRPILRDCSFRGNLALEGGAIFTAAPGSLVCERSEFIGNIGHLKAGAVLGIGTFIGCSFVGNRTNITSGGAANGGGDFLNCRFLGNRSQLSGGAFMVLNACTLTNCTFTGNQSESDGAALHVWSDANTTIVNCTIAANTTLEGAGGLAVKGPTSLSNSVVWGNSNAQISGEPLVTYSCIEGGWPGVGNISSSPAFVDLLGIDGVVGTTDDDCRLMADSACIDAADNLALPPDGLDIDGDRNVAEPLPCDLDHSPRRINDPTVLDTGNPGWMGAAIVDIGAYEFNDIEPLIGDATSDGVVDVDDLIAVILGWGPCDDPKTCPADVAPPPPVGGDGVINTNDLILVIEHWSS